MDKHKTTKNEGSLKDFVEKEQNKHKERLQFRVYKNKINKREKNNIRSKVTNSKKIVIQITVGLS